MVEKLRRSAGLLLAWSGLAASAPAQASPPGPPASGPFAGDAAAARVAARTPRLAVQKQALEAQLAAMERFGRQEEFLAAIRARTVQPPDWKRRHTSHYRFGDSAVPAALFAAYDAWHSPAPGRSLPFHADVEAPGHPFPAIVDFARQLDEHAIDLLVLFIPSRIEIEPELLIPIESDAGFAGMGIGTVRLQLALNAAGVESLDLRGPMARERGLAGADGPRDPLFVRTDPHWSPRGAEVAARVVADHVRRLPWFRPGPLVEGRDYRVACNPFAVSGGEESLLLPDTEPEIFRFDSLMTMDGDRVFAAASPRSRITVTGDSFVGVFEIRGADVSSQIARRLGHRIDRVAVNGGGALRCRQTLARRAPETWDDRRIVVWFISAGDVHPSEQWKKVALFEQ